jgi:hypothetical protein
VSRAGEVADGMGPPTPDHPLPLQSGGSVQVDRGRELGGLPFFFRFLREFLLRFLRLFLRLSRSIQGESRFVENYSAPFPETKGDS